MFRRTSRWRALVIAVALVVPLVATASVSTSATAAPRPWRMIDLGAGDVSIATAINDRGHVVIQTDGGALLWRNGRLTNLGDFTPADINNRDEVVGTRPALGGGRAVLWRNGVLTDLGRLPGEQSNTAEAINDRTEIVGWGFRGAEDPAPWRAFVWRRGVLTGLSGDDGKAFDINDRGQIVGTVGQVPVRWWRGNRIRLAPEPSDFGDAVAVNRSGTVTGQYSAEGSQGFLWRRGTFIVLPPPPPSEGFQNLFPHGINDREQVVGGSSDGAFVWEDGRRTNLPGLTRDAVALDINERGVIAGRNPASPDGTLPHAVIWVR